MQPHLWQFLTSFAGWVNRSQQDVIEYLKEENCSGSSSVPAAYVSRMTSVGAWQRRRRRRDT